MFRFLKSKNTYSYSFLFWFNGWSTIFPDVWRNNFIKFKMHILLDTFSVNHIKKLDNTILRLQ